MRETIGAVVRKPVFRIKLIAISLLFVVSLIEQVSNNYIQSSGQQVGRMTVMLLLMHTFSYFSFYLSVFFPDAETDSPGKCEDAADVRRGPGKGTG